MEIKHGLNGTTLHLSTDVDRPRRAVVLHRHVFHPNGWTKAFRAACRQDTAQRRQLEALMSNGDLNRELLAVLEFSPVFGEGLEQPEEQAVSVDPEDFEDDYDNLEFDGIDEVDEEIVPAEMFGHEIESGDECDDECPHCLGDLDHGYCHECGFEAHRPADMKQCARHNMCELAHLHKEACR